MDLYEIFGQFYKLETLEGMDEFCDYMSKFYYIGKYLDNFHKFSQIMEVSKGEI